MGAFSWYRLGTASVTQNSASIGGTGTGWVAGGIALGDVFTTDFVALYEVTAITSDTAITLDRLYAGPTAGSVAYAIIRNFSPLPATVLEALQSLITTYGNLTGCIPAAFGTGAPVSLIANGAFYVDTATGNLWVQQASAWMELSASGGSGGTTDFADLSGINFAGTTDGAVLQYQTALGGWAADPVLDGGNF